MIFTYKILEECINLNDISKIVKKVLNNYKNFIELKNLSYDFNLDKFKLEIYSKNDYAPKNIFTMFRILEKKFYKLLKNMNFIKLDYKNEIANDKSENKYITIITDNNLNLDIFKVYLLFYYLNLKFNSGTYYLGIDFEFNTKKVALMQINFEQPNKDLFNISLIFMFDPVQLNQNWKTFFVQKIFCNLNCYKILHGSDSLDIPFVYNELLFNDIKFIKKFNERFIDTKFLCEYRYYSNNQSLGKCKIYNVLKDDGIITEKKYNLLLENDKNMGPIYDIIINVNKLSKNLIYYTLYDVLFLTHLVEKYKKMKSFDLIVELTQFIFLEKKGINNVIPIEELNKINNYVISFNGIHRINVLFNDEFIKFINENNTINNILKINYFKKTLTNLFKFLFYRELCKQFNVYVKVSGGKVLYDKGILKNDVNFNFKNFNLIINSFLDVINKIKIGRKI